MRVKLLIVCFILFATNGFAQQKFKGEQGVTSIGGIVGVAVESEMAVVGVDYRYNIHDRLRLAPSVLYLVKKNYSDIWYLNADAHYLARITRDITLYPIGGLGASVWSYYRIGDMILKDIKYRFGFNMGFGGEIRLTKDIIVGGEFKYNLTERGYNQAMILARVAYYF